MDRRAAEHTTQTVHRRLTPTVPSQGPPGWTTWGVLRPGNRPVRAVTRETTAGDTFEGHDP